MLASAICAALAAIAAVVFAITSSPWTCFEVLIPAWLIVGGLLHVSAAKRLRGRVENGQLALAGFLCILLGAPMIVDPGLGAMASYLIGGVFVIVYGALLVGFALKLRSHAISLTGADSGSDEKAR